jgi:LPXTG-motif cell wall-anchored protein
MSAGVRRAAILLAAVGCAVMSTAVVALAQTSPYPANAPTCSVAQGTVAPGESVTVSGENWLPNSAVTISLKGDGTLGSATTDGEGSFSTVVTIPSSAPTGLTEIICSGRRQNGDPFVLGTTITIGSAGGGIASTGAQIQVWMFLSIALLGVGLGLLLIARRRRSSPLR